MSNIRAIPFTEIVERIEDLGRVGTETKKRTRAVVNEIYTIDIPNDYDHHWLKSSSGIACIAEYDTGTTKINTQSTAVMFGSGAVIDSSFTGRKIKFDDNPDVYDFTFSKANSGTISPPLSGVVNLSCASYTIFKNIYSLPADFDRFPVNGGLLFYSAGQPQPLAPILDDDYYSQVNASPTDVPTNCRFVGYDTAGQLQVEILPPPASPYLLINEYIKALSPMIESTMGTIVVSSNQTTVSGTSTYFTQMNSGDYIRADNFGKGGDSTWYRIAVVNNASTITLSSNFRIDSNYTGSYTISKAPLMPYRMQPALIWGSLMKLLPDQKDPMFITATRNYAKIMSDNRVLEQSRYAKDTVELIAEDYDYRW